MNKAFAISLLLAVSVGTTIALWSKEDGSQSPAEASRSMSDEGPRLKGDLTPPAPSDSRLASEAVPATEETDPSREPWIPSGDDLNPGGQAPSEIMRTWHGPMWPRIEAAVMSELDDSPLPDDIGSLGNVDGCLQLLPDLALKWFERSFMTKSLYHFPGLHSGEWLSASLALELVTESDAYNPTGRAFDDSSPQWSETGEWLIQEHLALREVADSVIGEQRSTLQSVLGSVDRYNRPTTGELLFGPIRTVPHPDHAATAKRSSYDRATLLIGDPSSDCRMFSAFFHIEWRDVPTVWGLLETYKTYQSDLRRRIQSRVDSLP